jgi:hypothetical protein
MSGKSIIKKPAPENPIPPESTAKPTIAKLRCAWSGEMGKKLKPLGDFGLTSKGEPVSLYALPEYENKVRAFVTYYKRFRPLFQGLIAVGIAAIFLATLGGVLWLEPFAWLFTGLVLLVFPFAHSPNFQGMSLRASTRLARVVGLGCVVLALVLFL